jgi:hypothetical protein
MDIFDVAGTIGREAEPLAAAAMGFMLDHLDEVSGLVQCHRVCVCMPSGLVQCHRMCVVCVCVCVYVCIASTIGCMWTSTAPPYVCVYVCLQSTVGHVQSVKAPRRRCHVC